MQTFWRKAGRSDQRTLRRPRIADFSPIVCVFIVLSEMKMPAGDNRINIGRGANNVTGTDAGDTFVFTDIKYIPPQPTSIGHIDGGAGYDTIDLSNFNPGFFAPITDESGNQVPGINAAYNPYQFYNQPYTFSNIEQIIFGPSNDVINFLNYGKDVLLTIHGGGGDDSFLGGSGGYLFGDDGNDRFSIRGYGVFHIDGGTGNDIVYYGYAISHDYTISASSDGISLARGGAVSTISNVEDVSFIDGHLITDPNSYGAQVQRIFDTVLLRQVDLSGLNFWVHKMDAGATLSSVANGLLGSVEYQHDVGAINNSNFVQNLYLTALKTTPDDMGFNFWMGQLNSGMSRGQVAAYFSETSEHRTLTESSTSLGYFDTTPGFQQIALLYDSAFGRLPDSGGLQYWARSLVFSSVERVADIFSKTSDFSNATAGLTNKQLVDYMYEHTLHRAGDAAGSAFWVDQVDHGLTKGALLFNFAESVEHSNLDVANFANGIVVVG